MEKQKIHLTQEKETLLVPLYSKALESRRPHPILVDPEAKKILAGIAYAFREPGIPRQTLITLVMRASSTL